MPTGFSLLEQLQPALRGSGNSMVAAASVDFVLTALTGLGLLCLLARAVCSAATFVDAATLAAASSSAALFAAASSATFIAAASSSATFIAAASSAALIAAASS